eukprot:Hpha_TRINITY_DN5662_c0_g1::TRINITY_DN5662_c0_g1_i1::g.50686::m.50686
MAQQAAMPSAAQAAASSVKAITSAHSPLRHAPAPNLFPETRATKKKVAAPQKPQSKEEIFMDQMQNAKLPEPHIWGIPKMSKGKVPGFKHSVSKKDFQKALGSRPDVSSAVYKV